MTSTGLGRRVPKLEERRSRGEMAITKTGRAPETLPEEFD
jgi:hypothetical protein